MKVSDLIATVRDMLQDDEKVRYSDESLIRALNMGVLDVRRQRPDYFIGRYYAETSTYSSPSDDLNLPSQLFSPLVKYVAGMVEMRDDEYTADGRAASFIKMFSVDLGV